MWAENNGVLSSAGTRWQDGYYDTLISTEKQSHFVSEYIFENPVKKGLCGERGDWDASSLKVPDAVAANWPHLLNTGESGR